MAIFTHALQGGNLLEYTISYDLWRVQNLGICCAKNGGATSKIGTRGPNQKFLGKTNFRNCSSSRGCQRDAWNSSGPKTDPRGTPQQALHGYSMRMHYIATLELAGFHGK